MTHFIDPLFPPDDSSIYSRKTEEYPFPNIVHWRRPNEFMTDPQLFLDDIEPDDIKQGVVPDCWFLGALASLSERPTLVRRLFITDEYNEEGIYRVRLCKNGEWIIVTVDDYIPGFYNGGPIFTRSNGNELWVMILEKAYAKLHGTYSCLQYGFTWEAMIDLSGCPTENIEFKEEPEHDLESEEGIQKLWDRIDTANERGYLISGETEGQDVYTKQGGLQGGGLVPGHAYSIIHTVEANDIKLLNIRNPWGRFEWEGAWSDKDKNWTKEMISLVNPVLDSNDGSFWMGIEDFIDNFQSVNICKLKNWEEVRVKGKFLKAVKADCDYVDEVISKFYYKFEVKSPTKTIITLHQEDQRILGSLKRPLLDVSFILFKINKKTQNLSVYKTVLFQRERDLQQPMSLGKGTYILLPITTGCMLQQPHDPKFPELSLYIENEEGVMEMHPFIKSIGKDIFNKIGNISH